MSSAALTIFVWAIYVLVIGTLLAVVPNTVLSLFDLPETGEVWIKVLGIVLVLLALYYADSAWSEARHLYVASILGRGFAAAALIVLVITGEPWQLLIFAAVEVVGLTWTYGTLRSDAGSE